MKNFQLCDGSCKEQQGLYGTWFAANGSDNYYIDKCATLIGRYKTWSENLEQLLSEKKDKMLKARDEEIRNFLSRYTPEEIAAFQNGNSN